MQINELLTFVISHNASDLHISAGDAPLIRIDGDLRRLDMPALEQKQVNELLYSVMNENQQKLFETDWEVDFSINIDNLSRFRVNVFRQNRGIAGAFRTIPSQVATIDQLFLPAHFKQIADYNNGLVLVTGPTGSGKSTTLASIIHHINQTRDHHIITIEDPIEYVHTCRKSLINQREVHRDTKSFANALRAALREDPDVILVGEMRDIETIRLALTAAETGHLVFGTLHTISAPKTINRIVDVFPAEEKAMVRTMLSESLQMVISQVLLKKTGGGRIAGLEVMRCIPAIRNLIREDKIPQIYSTLQTHRAAGMHTLDQHLQELATKGYITREIAQKAAEHKEGLLGTPAMA